MANPKYIDKIFLNKPEEEDDSKNVIKKPYSFRCDETLLEDMNTYAELEGITVPQLISGVMADFINKKTLTNTYLTEYEGRYISIRSNADDNVEFEYDLRYIFNNMDEWSSLHGYVSKKGIGHGIIHEGIDFLIIPETLHTGKLSESDKVGLNIDYSLNLNNIPKCIYCIYLTVDAGGNVEYDIISWIDAINKLKAVGRYDLISYGNAIKKKLESLYNDYIRDAGMYDVELMWEVVYGRVLKIAKDYNTGAIIPASSSIDNIEYAPVVEHLPDSYQLMKENDELKKQLSKVDEVMEIFDQMEAVAERLDELERKRNDPEYREEVWQEIKDGNNQDEISDDNVDELPTDELVVERTLDDGTTEEITLQRSNDDLPESDDEDM